jgi:hypothetical protein
MALTFPVPVITPTPVITDPDFASVSALLPLNGPNGSTSFPDASTNAIAFTAFGNAQISTAESQWGGSSLLLDGSGDYVLSATSTLFDLSGTDTLELWFRPIDLTGTRTIMHLHAGGSNGLHLYTAGTELRVDNGLVADYGSGAGVMFTNTWTFLRLTVVGGTLYVAKDSTVLYSGTAQSYGTPDQLRIGRYGTGGVTSDAHGYYQDVRYTKGVARSTTSLTAPSAPFPTS